MFNNRAYISGPITNTRFYRLKFKIIEILLKLQGYEVLNPCFIRANLTWNEYMEIDLAMLKLCGTIYMMKGWKNSKGARVEYEYASTHGFLVIGETNED